jgi:Protein of unknown function (DUF3098)
MAKPNKTQPAARPQEAPRATAPRTTAPRSRTSAPSVFGQKNDTLVFGRENYKWMLIGIAIMAVGFVCMSGGAMPSPDVWDESIIYSPMRIAIAPILILIGLGVEVYAIFKQNDSTDTSNLEATPNSAE